MILLAKGDTQWQAVDSCSVHDPHDASLDFVTDYCVDDPSYGFGGDAADLDFGSDYFSACDDPGLDYDYGQTWLLSSFKNKPTSSLMYSFPGIFPFIILKTRVSPEWLTCVFSPCFYYGSGSSSSCGRVSTLITEVSLSLPRKPNDREARMKQKPAKDQSLEDSTVGIHDHGMTLVYTQPWTLSGIWNGHFPSMEQDSIWCFQIRDPLVILFKWNTSKLGLIH